MLGLGIKIFRIENLSLEEREIVMVKSGRI